MPDATGALIGGSSLLGGMMQGESMERSAQLQLQGTQEAILSQQRQFDEIKKLLSPFVSAGQFSTDILRPDRSFGGEILGAGQTAFGMLSSLAGASGTQAEREMIEQIEQSPLFRDRVRQGEEAILQRASATGGLRGGNVQAALAQFRPQMLSEEIEQRRGRLSGLASTAIGLQTDLARLGQASAAQQALSGGQSASSIAGLLQDAGAARGAATQAGGTALAGQFLSSIPSMVGTYQGLTGRSLFGAPIVDRNIY